MHLWLGIALGLYLCVISLTGAALLFRIDLQRLENPRLLTASSPDITLDIAEVAGRIAVEYPRGEIVGVDAPTTARPVYLAYVTDHEGFHTVLADPSTGAVLGELPDHSFVASLQNLHFNLLGGEVGERVNGAGALCLILLAITGLVIWWPGRKRWRRALKVRWSGNRERRLWELHGATGMWAVVLILLWAVTALSFTFPQQFRAVVTALSPQSTKSRPVSNVALAGAVDEHPPLRTLVARAAKQVPGQYAARVVLPSSASDPVQVLFSPERPTPVVAMNLTTIFLDRYSGEVLPAPPQAALSRGDRILTWVGPLHVGSFGGWPIKAIWLIAGLAPTILFLTGFITWWRRVVRPAYLQSSTARAAYDAE
ncbi:MAG: PepSY-associated TM helix domain-containing protein [Gammaproteobacteria bacterium]